MNIMCTYLIYISTFHDFKDVIMRLQRGTKTVILKGTTYDKDYCCPCPSTFRHNMPYVITSAFGRCSSQRETPPNAANITCKHLRIVCFSNGFSILCAQNEYNDQQWRKHTYSELNCRNIGIEYLPKALACTTHRAINRGVSKFLAVLQI